MKRLCFAICVMGACWASGVQAQQPEDMGVGSRIEVSPGLVSPTPEMWFYQQQLRRRADPWEAIRVRAEFQAAQRVQRMASQKWYGYSPSRPAASPNPFMTTYSPAWLSNSYDRYAWRGGSSHVVVLRPETRTY